MADTDHEPKIELILEEYRTLRTEILNAQRGRLQVVSLTIGAYGAILTVLGRVIVTPNMNPGNLQTITVGMMAILWAFLIPSLMMIISTQQSILRKAVYIRDFIEANIPELRWETIWCNSKKEKSNRVRGVRGMGGLYIFLTILPLILPIYAVINCQPAQLWVFLWPFLLPLPLMVAALVLCHNFQAHKPKNRWEWKWESNDWENRRLLNHTDRNIFKPGPSQSATRKRPLKQFFEWIWRKLKQLFGWIWQKLEQLYKWIMRKPHNKREQP